MFSYFFDLYAESKLPPSKWESNSKQVSFMDGSERQSSDHEGRALNDWWGRF